MLLKVNIGHLSLYSLLLRNREITANICLPVTKQGKSTLVPPPVARLSGLLEQQPNHVQSDSNTLLLFYIETGKHDEIGATFLYWQ